MPPFRDAIENDVEETAEMIDTAIRDKWKVFTVAIDTVIQLGLCLLNCNIVLCRWVAKELANLARTICDYRDQPCILCPAFASYQLRSHRFNWSRESAKWTSFGSPRTCATSNVCCFCVFNDLEIEEKRLAVRHDLQSDRVSPSLCKPK